MTTSETDSSTEKAQSVTKEMMAPEEEKKREESTFDEETQDDISHNVEQKTNDRRKYADWPVRDIKEPHNNDVLYGRGGGTNHHSGNKRFRRMVEDRKIDYVNCKRLDKPLVALGIIREWRGQDPPGRFLKLDEKLGLWFDVGDKKAREKTSQALREKAPLIRQQQEEERLMFDRSEDGDSDRDDFDDDTIKNTRFADGTNLEGKNPNKPLLARDHSLGREYLAPDEAVTIDGFSWQDPFESDDLRVKSVGSYSSQTSMSSQMYLAPSRVGSISSAGPGVPPGEQYGYYGGMGPPPPPLPPPSTYEHSSSGDRNSSITSWGNFERWDSAGRGGGPPPPPQYYYPPQPTSSWSRDHSLSQNPLSHASVNQPAYPYAFDSRRVGSSGWSHPPPPPPYGHYYPPPHEGAPPHYRTHDSQPPHDGSQQHYRPHEAHVPPESAPPHYRPHEAHAPPESAPPHYRPHEAHAPPESAPPHYRPHEAHAPPESAPSHYRPHEAHAPSESPVHHYRPHEGHMPPPPDISHPHYQYRPHESQKPPERVQMPPDSSHSHQRPHDAQISPDRVRMPHDSSYSHYRPQEFPSQGKPHQPHLNSETTQLPYVSAPYSNNTQQYQERSPVADMKYKQVQADNHGKYEPKNYSPISASHTSPKGSETIGTTGSKQEYPRSPLYSIDPAVASQWSGQDQAEIAKTLSTGSEEHDKFTASPMPSKSMYLKVPKPDLVKRATSNQNETIETKPDLVGPSVKRAALNRDNSMASNRLKEQYMPRNFDAEKAVTVLTENLEQSKIGTDDLLPVSLSNTARSTTLENIEMDLMVRPVNLTATSRSSTIDYLNLDFDNDDPFYQSLQQEGPALDDLIEDWKQGVPRPNALSASQRLTTSEIMGLVQGPIKDDFLEEL